jgi:REP element-mobilizing transposase RayT
MPQSLSRILIHLIFSTKGREPYIPPEIQPRLHAYLSGVAANLDSPSLRIGGVADHVHLLLALGRTVSIAEVVEEVKKASSRWMKADGGVNHFSWQSGYGAFSIGESQVDTLVRYINNQERHHRTMSFQDEYRRLLERYGVPSDERYLWD